MEQVFLSGSEGEYTNYVTFNPTATVARYRSSHLIPRQNCFFRYTHNTEIHRSLLSHTAEYVIMSHNHKTE